MAGPHREPRLRSRSPRASPRDSHRRERSNSQDGKHSRRHHHAHHRSKAKKQEPTVLPFRAAKLTKHGLSTYRPLFASYLDIQKQMDIEDLPDEEVRGRWKSFVGKWNRGELAEGWYDPETTRKALASASTNPSKNTQSRPQVPNNAEAASRHRQQAAGNGDEDEDEDADTSEDDSYGPRAPPTSHRGPAPPGFEDLALRDELDAYEARARSTAMRDARKQERRLQKERLEELAPRAEPGTQERQLEKRRENAAANRSFAEGRSDAVEEVRDADLLGGGAEDDIRARRREGERKKNEREMRKEEVLRARAEEREVRLRGMREKEDETMALLQAIAKERFGGGGG